MNRSFDVALAGLGLVVASPLLAVAALAAKLEDGGPVLFRQMRVGKDGEDFELLKLRSMVVDAERQGAGFAVDRGDARITRVGRVIRRTSIDELPQLWNVVRGDMSVIGPRPTLRYQVERYTERQRRRLEVLPGLTGWAQIHGRATLPWAERIELDVWYVEHRSPRVDLKILLRTPLALLRRHVQGHDGGMARGGMTERRAARIGVVCALVVILAQLVVASAWSLGHDDPTELALTRQCLEREKGLAVGPADDSVAASASGGALATVVEGNAVTLSVGRSEAEVERLRSAYSASGDPGTRLDLHGRYVALWHREPSPTQRQVTYDCAY